MFENESPKGWAAFHKLSKDKPALDVLLRVKLIELAFTAGGSASIRAIGMLFGLRFDVLDDQVEEGDHDAMESLSRRYLESRGYNVRRVNEGGPE